MIRYQFFPRSAGVTPSIQVIVDCFFAVDDQISSDTHNLVSDAVLEVLRPHLQGIGATVETGKQSSQKIPVPVLFGLNNVIDKYFYADAKSSDGTIVLEIEAGRATENYQFLKDIFQACMMHGIEYLSSHAKESRYLLSGLVPTCARMSVTLWQSVSKFW